MNNKKDFFTDIENIPTDDIRLFFRILLQHFSPDQFGIVGGLAIRYWYSVKSVTIPPKKWNDLDISVESIDAVPNTLAQDFLIGHYHLPKEPGGYFYVAFVHKETKIKCDIFPYWPSHKDRFIKMPFEDTFLHIKNIEEQLIKTVFDISNVSESQHMDPKQFEDAKRLMSIADMDKAQKTWQETNFKDRPNTIVGAIAFAEQKRAEHPEWVVEKPHRKPADFKCPECTIHPDFPLTPIGELYKILE